MNHCRGKWRKAVKYELFILPALVVYLVFCLYPFLSTFYFSMTDYTDVHISNLNFVGLNNFFSVLADKALISSVKNSIIFALFFTFFQSLFAIPLAVFLDRKLKTRNLLRLIYFLPAVFSSLAVGFLWNYLMSTTDFGLFNQILTSIGMNKINFLGDGHIALYSVILSQVWQWTGWAMVIYLANLQSIPRDYYEAAMIDGSNSWSSFWRITLPLLYPSVSVVLVFSMISGLKVFDIIFSMTQGGPGYSTETIITAMIKKAFTDGFPGEAAALGVIFFIVVTIISVAMLKILGKWEKSLS